MSNKKRSRSGSKARSAAYSPPKNRPTRRRESTASPRRRLSSTAVVAGIVAVLVVAVVAASVLFSGGESGITDSEAWDLPALTDSGDEDGDGRITLADYGGTPLVLNFFASWCTSCEAELPRFVEAERRASGAVEFVFVNSNETGNWRPMAGRTGIDDRSLVKDINGTGGNGLYFSLGGSGGMPMTAFYDADGNLVHVDRGELSYNALATRVQTLFGVGV